MLWDSGEDKMIYGLIVALQFLTRLPVNIMVDFNDENIGKSTFFFPFVGMLLGIIAYIPFYILGNYNIEIGSFLVLLFIIILTGGLHLDGLSDMFDGFFANRDKDRTLEIMADSRIGAFGVLSLILLILFKFILIKNLSNDLMWALVFSMGNSRFVALIQIAFKKIAKPGGLGDMIHKTNPKKYIISSFIIYIAIILVVNYKFIIPLLLSILMGEIISRASYKKLGGFTGDVYGATIELSEIVSLLGFIGVLQWI